MYTNVHAGRQIAGWLTDAGLKELRVEVRAERVQYCGSPHMAPSVRDVVPVREPKTPTEREIALVTQELIDGGLPDAVTVERAREEIVAWYQDPHSFHFSLLIFAAGRAP